MEKWKLHPAVDSELPESERWRSLRREGGLLSSLLHFGFRALTRNYLALWHRLRVVGGENVPVRPPFVLVANHTSHLDALVLDAALPCWRSGRVFPVAAGDVFFDRTWKSALAAILLNALPMWRRHCGPQAIKQLRHRLIHEPCGYILFPEGGRSRDGSLHAFRNGIGALVAETRVPVYPCHLSGCFQALRPETCLPLPARISVAFGRPLTFESQCNDRSGWSYIASRLQEEVAALALASGDAPSFARQFPTKDGLTT